MAGRRVVCTRRHRRICCLTAVTRSRPFILSWLLIYTRGTINIKNIYIKAQFSLIQ
jgi:hypothetical protein